MKIELNGMLGLLQNIYLPKLYELCGCKNGDPNIKTPSGTSLDDMYDLCRFYFAHLWYVYKHGQSQSLKRTQPREEYKPFKFHDMHGSNLLEALRNELSRLSDDTSSEEYHLLHEQPPFWNSFKGASGPPNPQLTAKPQTSRQTHQLTQSYLNFQ